MLLEMLDTHRSMNGFKDLFYLVERSVRYNV